ncbi:hypothetical protein FHT44_001690 [Mycolicibacterium sp. BK634]|uniref:GOLPH3/VPS74 family protein n=1 Tax=Mycolicibacterium sp. BK634 TaxID=2587099 RepID=UPI0016075B36|nr:GPP34 family phosphoprotein [Mycolicibacterium sp. BK634]MBB3749229.1 hypothetical protein [Mycolicibacterium sp. BK634]
MDLPRTLYGQLYLLAYDRRRRRFDYGKLWLLDHALRGAMLAELLEAGHLQDVNGSARRGRGRLPADPVLRAIVETIDNDNPKSWSLLVGWSDLDTSGLVRQQLEHYGWICPQRRTTFGFIPTRCVGLSDEAPAAGLADRATQALRDAIGDRPADPRALTLGLLTVLCELPLLGKSELRRHCDKLRILALASAVPVVGVYQAVEAVHAELRAKNHSHNHSDGGGCGGGCGGCGGCGG